ncbi:MAG TPA: hypothetical protein ENL38_05770, partial [Candidatus Aminicenantes bacterium]|nr:hypothetical protein [Candidatus Aminicenantes bacterium]
MRKIFLTALICLGGVFFLWSQEVKKVGALKTEAEIIVDGALNEAVWQKAPTASNFIQFEPQRGKPATLRTVVRVLY